MIRYLVGALLAACLLGRTVAAPVPWPMEPYAQTLGDSSVGGALARLAERFSLRLIGAEPLHTPLSGTLEAKSPSAFLDTLGGLHGFQWFTHQGALYVSLPAQAVTRVIPVSGGALSGLRTALTRAGVLDARFGWGELFEQGAVVVSGPPAYVALVERTMAALPAPDTEEAIVVFPLKHAFVADRIQTYRDQQLLTPGLATTLSQLLAGVSSGAEGASRTRMLPTSSERSVASDPILRDTLALLRGREPGAASDSGAIEPQSDISPHIGGVSRRAGLGTIQADRRLNALIIRDTPARIPLYRRLIERLDRPVAMLHIDAMILDVNTSRLNELGISWGLRSGGFQFSSGPADVLSGLGRGVAASIAPGAIGLSVGNAFAARLNALERDDDASVQSQSSVLTVENLGAIIDLSETVYLETISERTATVTPITVGTSLRVTPRTLVIDGAYEVELAVDIEDGMNVQGDRADRRQTIRRGTISTLAVVRDNEALLIGGYTQSRTNETVDKVPFLGDLPFVGALFRETRQQTQQRERLFIIRPRIVAMDGRRLDIGPTVTINGPQAVGAAWVAQAMNAPPRHVLPRDLPVSISQSRLTD